MHQGYAHDGELHGLELSSICSLYSVPKVFFLSVYTVLLVVLFLSGVHALFESFQPSYLTDPVHGTAWHPPVSKTGVYYRCQSSPGHLNSWLSLKTGNVAVLSVSFCQIEDVVSGRQGEDHFNLPCCLPSYTLQRELIPLQRFSPCLPPAMSSICQNETDSPATFPVLKDNWESRGLREDRCQ